MSVEVTISGTVGAALEAGAFGVAALTVSLEMDPAFHLTGDERADYTGAVAFTRRLARWLLDGELPYGVDALNVNVPSDATPQTAARLTRLSRHRYFTPLPPDRKNGQGRPGYELIADARKTELDSDIWALLVERVISVMPLSLDLTAQAGLGIFLPGDLVARKEMSGSAPKQPRRRPLRPVAGLFTQGQ